MQQGQGQTNVTGGKDSRSIKNYILQPLLQIKLGLYSIILSTVFALVIVGILYLNLAKFSDIILELTGVKDEVKDLLEQYLSPAAFQIFLAAALYVLINMVMTIVYTHRLIGPTIAFRRHIRMIAEGKYEHRTVLRKGDAFNEIADDLNKLSALLEQKARQS
jgi:hypothetical protein